MIPASVREEVLRRLAAIERFDGVRVLFAIESGSRAWGFASPDSDYDVRFVYVRPTQHYLSIDIDLQRDVIERPIVDEIDLNGWDVRKALRLLGKSNPAIVEWLQSPITYRDDGRFRSSAIALLPRVYAIKSGLRHYRSMAARNYRDFLQSDEVRLKKYLYVLRPLLAGRWIETHGGPPPIPFRELLGVLPTELRLREAIDDLLQKKQASGELDKGPRVALLNAFIEAELKRAVTGGHESGAKAEMQALNELFWQTLA